MVANHDIIIRPGLSMAPGEHRRPLLTPSNFPLLFISLSHHAKALHHISTAVNMIIPTIYYNCNHYSGTLAAAFFCKRLSNFIYMCINTAKSKVGVKLRLYVVYSSSIWFLKREKRWEMDSVGKVFGKNRWFDELERTYEAKYGTVKIATY